MGDFTIYPAIDLRAGQVVRLRQGDPARQTVYGADPAAQARAWAEAGARWLHVVNLDGAFDQADNLNQAALGQILAECAKSGVKVQFGGGLRSLLDIQRALGLGVERVLLGTAAVQSPELVRTALQRWGAGRIGAALDAQDGVIRTHGWTESSGVSALDLGRRLAQAGLLNVIYTDIARDGTGSGANLAACLALQQASGLAVIVSGGIRALDEIRQARQMGLAGVIAGRALYEGHFSLEEALAC